MTNPVIGEQVLTVQAMDGQYLFDSFGLHDDPWPEPWQALTGGDHTWISVLTGTHYGPIDIRLQVHTAAPTDVDAGWEMVGERDLWCNEGGLRLHDLYSNEPGCHLDVQPGPYRVRIHVAGRAEAASIGDTKTPVERHFIQLWPTSIDAPPELHIGPDEYAHRRA